MKYCVSVVSGTHRAGTPGVLTVADVIGLINTLLPGKGR